MLHHPAGCGMVRATSSPVPACATSRGSLSRSMPDDPGTDETLGLSGGTVRDLFATSSRALRRDDRGADCNTCPVSASNSYTAGELPAPGVLLRLSGAVAASRGMSTSGERYGARASTRAVACTRARARGRRQASWACVMRCAGPGRTGARKQASSARRRCGRTQGRRDATERIARSARAATVVAATSTHRGRGARIDRDHQAAQRVLAGGLVEKMESGSQGRRLAEGAEEADAFASYSAMRVGGRRARAEMVRAIAHRRVGDTGMPTSSTHAPHRGRVELRRRQTGDRRCSAAKIGSG